MTSEPAEGLRLDQAPPLCIPLSFFLTAPVFVLAAGALLVLGGRGLVLSRYAPLTLAFTHLGTLGVLAMVMLGALYQMTPVVAASPVPHVRLAHLVHATLTCGVLALALGLALQHRAALHAAFALLGTALIAFVVPVGSALRRSPAKGDPTVRGMQVAVASLAVAAALGLWMAHGHAGMRFPGPRPAWMAVHVGVAVLGFIGALITAVSFQVVPMFYLTPALSLGRRRALIAAIALPVAGATSLLSLAKLGAVADELVVRLGHAVLAPAALAVWGVHPALTLRAIARRKRRRADTTLAFFQLGLSVGLLCLPLACAAVLVDDPRAPLALGWLALWGWALLIVHGMLYRIVPFLVWFHRLSHLVGVVPVPSAQKLLPATAPRRALLLHGGALALGLCAIALRSELLAQATGACLLATGAQLLHTLARVARYTAPAS